MTIVFAFKYQNNNMSLARETCFYNQARIPKKLYFISVRP